VPGFDLSTARLVPAPGSDGWLARVPGVVAWIPAASGDAVDDLLSACLGGSSSVDVLAHVASRLVDPDAPAWPPFALIAARTANVVVVLHGPTEVVVTDEQGSEIRLFGGDAVGSWLNRVFGDIASVRVGDPGDLGRLGPADLRAGVIPAAGAVLAASGLSVEGAGTPLGEAVAGATPASRSLADDAPAAGPAAVAGLPSAEPHGAIPAVAGPGLGSPDLDEVSASREEPAPAQAEDEDQAVTGLAPLGAFEADTEPPVAAAAAGGLFDYEVVATEPEEPIVGSWSRPARIPVAPDSEAETDRAIDISEDPTIIEGSHSSGVGGPPVSGVVCPDDHFNDPRDAFCRVCGLPLAPGLPEVERPRPPLGALVWDTGETTPLVADSLVGRDVGHDSRVASGELAPLEPAGHTESMSRVHAELRAQGWDVLLIDRGSTNGTFIWDEEGRAWHRLSPSQPQVLKPNTVVAFGERTATFDPAPVSV
jgi:hypothetical protein